MIDIFMAQVDFDDLPEEPTGSQSRHAIIGAILGQTLAIPILCTSATWFLLLLLYALTLVFGMPTEPLATALLWFVVAFLCLGSIGLGYFTSREENWSQSARHVWKLPLVLYVVSTGYAILRNGIADTIRSFFFPDVLLFAVTIPVASCCLYSLGAVFNHVAGVHRVKGQIGG